MPDKRRYLPIQDVEGMDGPFYFRYDEFGADTQAAAHSHSWGHLNYAAHGTMQMETDGLRLLSPPQYAVWIPPAVVHSCTLRHAIVYRSIYIEPGLCAQLPAEACTVRISPIIRSVLADFAARDVHVPRTPADLRLAHVVVDQLAQASVQRCYLAGGSHACLDYRA
ncbi:AraC family ligand binding domain-containing protein [Cupriavidus basilensis]